MNKQQMVSENMGLVGSIAKRFMGRGLPYEDLIQEGALGLIRACDTFDPSQGAFSTYATYWIKQTIGRAVLEQKGVAIPEYLFVRLAEYRKVESANPEMSPEDIAKSLKWDDSMLGHVRDAIRALGVASLDAPSDEDERKTIGSMLSTTDREVDDSAIKVRELLESNVLSEIEKTILKLRFGFDCDGPHSLSEIGAKLGKTKERIRQIEDKALRELRSNAAA